MTALLIDDEITTPDAPAGDLLESPPDEPNASRSCPFAGRVEKGVLRVRLRSGEVLRGSLLVMSGMHFIHERGPGLPLIGRVTGPLTAREVAEVELLEDAETVRERARLAFFGEPVPGREPVTRDDYEARLRTLARVHASTPSEEWQRQVQIRRQFDEVADRIQLSAGKREWLIREAAWSLRRNEPPEMADLWGSDVASPSLFARPRPQDFDPDPKRRRIRTKVPAEARRDPHSIPNMLSALKAAGLNARLRAPNALVKGSCGPGKEHEVVRNDAQDEFAPLRLVVASCQG